MMWVYPGHRAYTIFYFLQSVHDAARRKTMFQYRELPRNKKQKLPRARNNAI